jgi:hypothetical protein
MSMAPERLRFGDGKSPIAGSQKIDIRVAIRPTDTSDAHCSDPIAA